MKRGIKDLMAEAEAEITAISAEELKTLRQDPAVVVDLRETRELEREGQIPGALHAPRGMLEFWVDPDSPYHKQIFSSGKRFIFYCGLGWRSALATKAVQDMGLEPVAHLAGGFSAWLKAGGEVELRRK
jgi:rhodanese-related sulfurtransferase